jgi:hypothetical protein
MHHWGHDNYTVGRICALLLELAAACAMLDERHDPLPLESGSRDRRTPSNEEKKYIPATSLEHRPES